MYYRYLFLHNKNPDASCRCPSKGLRRVFAGALAGRLAVLLYMFLLRILLLLLFFDRKLPWNITVIYICICLYICIHIYVYVYICKGMICKRACDTIDFCNASYGLRVIRVVEYLLIPRNGLRIHLWWHTPKLHAFGNCFARSILPHLLGHCKRY